MPIGRTIHIFLVAQKTMELLKDLVAEPEKEQPLPWSKAVSQKNDGTVRWNVLPPCKTC